MALDLTQNIGDLFLDGVSKLRLESNFNTESNNVSIKRWKKVKYPRVK
jgi:hypothetical protein